MDKIIEAYIQELKDIGITPEIDKENGFVNIEFTFNKQVWDNFRKLLHKYVGFWKSIACHSSHDREKQIARFKVPFWMITGKDITDDQLIGIANKISKKI
jgi:hypothetical protein